MSKSFSNQTVVRFIFHNLKSKQWTSKNFTLRPCVYPRLRYVTWSKIRWCHWIVCLSISDSMSHATPLGGLWRPGWRGEGTQQMFIRGGLAPRSNFLPFYTPFFTEKYPFRMPSIDIPCLEFCIPFNCCKCITKKTFSRLYKAIKFICYPF